jgi:hypothetical protein
MPAGTYQIEVSAQQVPRVSPAVMADLLDVVDPDVTDDVTDGEGAGEG